MLQFGAGLLSLSFQESGAIGSKDGDTGFVKNHSAVTVADFANAQKVVLERWHDFGVADGKVELYVCVGRGMVCSAGRVAPRNYWS